MGAFRDIELIFSFSQMTSTYVKLQDAYAAESGAVGTWASIGYIGPGTKDGATKSSTTVFDYADVLDGTTNGSIMIGNLTTAKSGWSAKNKTALNDCKIQSEWKITVKGGSASNGSTVEYAATTPTVGNGETDGCSSLTPNFANIGK